MLLSWVDQKTSSGAHEISYSVAKDVLHILMQEDWRSLYSDKAVRSTIKYAKKEEAFLARSSIHVGNHVHNELNLTAAAMGACVDPDAYMPPQAHAFCAEITAFFGSKHFSDSLKSLLTARNWKDDLKWVKPLRQEVRTDLLQTLRSSRPEKRNKKANRKLYQLLYNHRDLLLDAMQYWEPAAEQFEPVILSLAESENFFESYLNNIHTTSNMRPRLSEESA